MTIKPSEALRFLAAIAAVLAVAIIIILRVTHARAPAADPGTNPAVPPSAARAPGAPLPAPASVAAADCAASGWRDAAQANAASLRTLAWAPYKRAETGWEVYAPLIARETGAACPPDTPGFAKALGAWQAAHGLPADGRVADATFQKLRIEVELRRPFVRASAQGICSPAASDAELVQGVPGEGYGGKPVLLRPAALEAYRGMVAAARHEDPAIAADPRNLTVFSSYRNPDADAANCDRDGNCDGVVKARCSPHRTGLALDLYMGQAPGYGPDSSADPNRLFMTRAPPYRWMLANAHRFGFANYPFEPWHWEWTGATR